MRAARPTIAAALVCATLGALARGQNTAPGSSGAPGDAGSPPPPGIAIQGRITSADGALTGDIVVYLEPTDPAVKFPAPAEHGVISQNGATFRPSLLVVCVGQTVEFRNDEDRPIEHNVFSRSATKEFDLGVYRPGVDKEVTFDQPGPVKLFCSIHRYMDGAIFVAPTPFFAYATSDGSYRIEGVPPGEYHVRTWQRKQRYDEADVTARIEEGSAGVRTINLSLKR